MGNNPSGKTRNVKTPPAVAGRDGIAAGPFQYSGSNLMTLVAGAKSSLKAKKTLPSD
jgi:hypothetical protein